MPLPPSNDSPYCDITNFDSNVLEYCKSITTAEMRFKMDARMSKVIIVGDMAVGKTSLVQRFVTNSFNHDYKATIGVDFEIERFLILNANFNLQMWDTAGQERFKCIAKAYYRGAQAIIVTFDASNLISLFNAEEWARNALSVVKTNEKQPFLFLVGTKKDLLNSTSNYEEVQRKTERLAQKLNAEYWFVSSCSGENVNAFFYRLASLVFNNSIRQELSISFTNSLKTIGAESNVFNKQKQQQKVDLSKNCKLT